MHSWNKLIIRGMVISLCCLLNHVALASPNIEGIQVYQKNLHLSEERKQNLADDIDRYKNADNIWDSMRQNFTLPHYEDNPHVEDQIEWFMSNQDFLYHSALRAAPYLYYIMQQVKKRHLPAEVALLPIIESSFNPFSYSSAGAAGIWQLMPGTASGLGIKQNWWYDGRRDVVASTKAALNYLTYLGEFFDGNWMYAIAAYNTGEGNVLAAIKKNIRNSESTNFWSLPVAQQTRDYIPKLLALAIIISHPDEYPVQLPYVRNAPYLAQVDVGSQIDLRHAANLAGLSFKQLKQLNPGFNRSTTGTRGGFKLVLPIENVEQFSENLADSSLSHNNTDTVDDSLRVKRKLELLASSENIPETPHGHYTIQPGDTLYMVRQGDDIEKIANRFHTSVKTLRTANNFSQGLIPGAKIIIPSHAIFTAESKKYQIAPGDTLYMVRKGDTLEKIAARYHISPAELRIANLMTEHHVKEGDQLLIPTHV